MTHQNIKPRDILAAIKEENPHNVSTRNAIYNARAKLGRMEQVGETPMQILFDRLEKVGQSFKTKESWERFLYKWRKLINSKTDLDYNYWYERIRSKLPSKKTDEIMDYLDSIWLQPYRDRFVSFWSDQHLNFGQHTTNRAEGQHALLKQYLGDSNYTLDKVVPLIDKLIRNQVTEIKGSIETSMSRTLDPHNKPIFNLLRKKVSHACLDLISAEVNEIENLKLSNGTCACRLYTSYGLPSACRLEPYTTNGQMIPLELIDPFWRKLNLDSILKLSEVDCFDLDDELAFLKQHLIAQPREVKKNLLQKMKELVQLKKTKLQQPVMQKNTRGRPTLKAQQQRKDDSFMEPSRHNFFTTQDEYSDSPVGFGTQETIIEPTRHSSFVESRSYCAETPMLFGEIAKGAKNSKMQKKVAKSKEEQPHLPLLPVAQVNMFMHFKKFIPPCFYPHPSHIQNVQGDDNCGFRSIAVALSLKEWDWPLIREELHAGCNRFHELWKTINEPEYQNVMESLV
ncbi:uncharacterized protein LOC110913941 [Helianthus annuus]|uniref:uncharacterized protein LOC110913941 n=1 Tax=Helianthus annuus TaxID=4232 RepID=UPI000B904FF4|nr:uncharacterized protein LOC110913941 [Helianthus annuus]